MKTNTKNEIIFTLVKRFFATIIFGIGFMVSVNAQTFCQAAFTYTVGTNGQVAFTNTSTGVGSNPVYSWSFGDNTWASATAPGHWYSYNGTYWVTLTIDSTNGGNYCSYSDSIVITNAHTCNVNAAFTYTVGSNGQVSFTDASTGVDPGMIYSWNWSGNSTYGNSNQQSPSTTFNYNGVYTINMSVGDPTNTCSSTITNTIVITNAQPCQVSFTYTVGSNGQVSFTNTSQGSINYNWGFGDGSYSTQNSPTHTYTYNGTYYIYLSADTTGGYCGGYFHDSIVITNAAPAPSCNASFTYTIGNNGQVSFTNTTSGTIVNPSYHWAFGDGNSSYVSSPTNTYLYNGTYNVTFWEYDSLNNYSCSYTQVITITNATPNTNCNDSVFFYMYKDSSQANTWDIYIGSLNTNYPVNAVWSWGDGTSSSGLYPSHTYASPGWYNICVTAYYACGDSSRYCENDSVYRSNSQMVHVNVIKAQTGIKNNINAINSVNAYPNPFADNLTINLNSRSGSSITYTICDLFGNQLMNEKVSVEKGENKIAINTTEFASGIYFVNITDNTSKKASTLKIAK